MALTIELQQIIVYLILAVVAVIILYRIVHIIFTAKQKKVVGCDCCSQKNCAIQKNLMEHSEKCTEKVVKSDK